MGRKSASRDLPHNKPLEALWKVDHVKSEVGKKVFRLHNVVTVRSQTGFSGVRFRSLPASASAKVPLDVPRYNPALDARLSK